jgi:hypothetical protein
MKITVYWPRKVILKIFLKTPRGNRTTGTIKANSSFKSASTKNNNNSVAFPSAEES